VITEVYDPKFDVFHDKPVVTWRERHQVGITTSLNLLEEYQHWLRNRGGLGNKYDPGDVFWQSNGPAICRALSYCRAKALVTQVETDRKVHYMWFTRKPDPNPLDPDRVDNHTWCICQVQAENLGGTNGVRVRVTLPTDEDVVFMFSHGEMQRWLKDEPKPEAKVS
jgi:hypothetical protein